MIVTDTTPEFSRLQVEIFRRMAPEERLRRGLELAQTCLDLMREGVRQRHPQYDEQQIREAVIRLTLPRELFLAAYPQAEETLP
jgi:hypothetical protein